MSSNSPVRIVLDTDMAMGVPGSDIDDGFALALALADPGIQVEAVTAVNGNADVESGVYLTKELLAMLGHAQVPVYRGATAPFRFPEKRRGAPEEIVQQFGHHTADAGFAAAKLAEIVAQNPGEITVVAIGPLTNVAAAINLDPNFPQLVKEIVIMGGVFFGYTHETSMPGEFNFWVDPEAANAVIRSGAKIKLVGLDVTLKVMLQRDHALEMERSGNEFEKFAGKYTVAWIDHLAERVPGSPSAGKECAMHDPLAVAAVTHPEFIQWVPAFVDIVDGDSIARGVAVTDLLRSADAPEPNVLVAQNVNSEEFLEFFFSSIKTL